MSLAGSGSGATPVPGPEYDKQEWDSPHCCSCCCRCCACHRISRAFWWVVLLTVLVFGAGTGVFLDGIIKQQNCSVDYSDPVSSDNYDECRQDAYVQLWASAAMAALFLLLLFVSCCAFMDVLCFRRFRSRPHMRPNAARRTPRAMAGGQTPRSPYVTYEGVPPVPQQYAQLHVHTATTPHPHGGGFSAVQMKSAQNAANAYANGAAPTQVQYPTQAAAGSSVAASATQPMSQPHPSAPPIPARPGSFSQPGGAPGGPNLSIAPPPSTPGMLAPPTERIVVPTPPV